MFTFIYVTSSVNNLLTVTHHFNSWQYITTDRKNVCYVRNYVWLSWTWTLTANTWTFGHSTMTNYHHPTYIIAAYWTYKSQLFNHADFKMTQPIYYTSDRHLFNVIVQYIYSSRKLKKSYEYFSLIDVVVYQYFPRCCLLIVVLKLSWFCNYFTIIHT